ncbi:hypothetical protein [Desulfitobacterium sp. PCE1]|uniref:hypothetical protein n=1 Tax=Desulfitobacterium sp. PCE1 TaxID=146907 RepID=UPI00036501E5|nr:hypothetical protein [Desulfitobacterium sp. PCE1]
MHIFIRSYYIGGEIIFTAIYLIINIIVMWLQISNYIPLNIAGFIALIMGVALLLLDILRIKKIKQKAGEILFLMESDWRTSPLIVSIDITLALIMFAISVLTIVSNRIPNEYLLYYAITIYVLVSELYLIFNVKSFFTENGMFFRGNMIKWDEIKFYRWKEPRFNHLKGYTILFLNKEDILWIREFKLMTNNSQRFELEKLLQHKKVEDMSGSTNDR